MKEVMVGHVARMGQVRNAYILVGKLGRDHLEDLGADGRTVLKCI
jgi:hypothetical protein